MSLLPSYLRSWIETETACKDEPRALRVTIDQDYDWVLVDYQKDASVGENQPDDLLQDYIVIEGQEKIQKKDEAWFDVGQKTSRCSRKSKRRARKRARSSADGHSPYLGIPFKFTKFPKKQIGPRWTGDVSMVKIDASKDRTRLPIIQFPFEQYDMQQSTVPFDGKNHVGVPEMIRVFQDLAKKTSTAIIYCDFAQLNAPNVCITRDAVCLKNSHEASQNYRAMNASDQYMFSDMKRDQFMHPGKLTREKYMVADCLTSEKPVEKSTCLDVVAHDQCICSNILTREQQMFPQMIPSDLNNQLVLPYGEAAEKKVEGILEAGCVDISKSKIFCLATSETLYSKFYTTKKRMEDLVKSLLLLHLVVSKKLQSWKDAAISNVSRLSFGYVIPAQCSVPHFDVTKPFPEKSYCHTNAGQVTGKQLRRQNRVAMRNNVVNSNRQRGMKCGRFQNNVGHHDSWH